MQQTATQPEHISEVLERVVSSEGSILIQPDASPGYATAYLEDPSDDPYGDLGMAKAEVIFRGLGFDVSKLSPPNGSSNGSNRNGHRAFKRMRPAIPRRHTTISAKPGTYHAFYRASIGVATGDFERQIEYKIQLLEEYFGRRFGPREGQTNLRNMDPMKVGSLFKHMVVDAEKRVYRQ